MSEPKRVYANVVRISTTPNEFVLEFGTFLPKSEDEAKAGVPSDFQFDLQVLMNSTQLDSLTKSLLEIQKRVEAAKIAQPLKRSN
ncbi:MAG: hypothetical protein HIU91_07560 [Acidobacteria bacterium]|nr:hypothetical protein [Acidobacteriota bacterium]